MIATIVCSYIMAACKRADSIVKKRKSSCFNTITATSSIKKIINHKISFSSLISFYVHLSKIAKFFKSKFSSCAYDSIEVYMREIALATRVENKNIIDFLQMHIKNRMDFCKIIITNYCDNNFCYLLFACDKEFYRVCEEIIRSVIIDYIESVYKVNFIKQMIKNPLGDTLAFNAYIKVLAIFDKTTDTNALKDIIIFNQTFFIDSFLEFRLNPLKSHWSNFANLSSDTITLFNSGTFVDIIRFLINTMDSDNYKVKVICDEEKFKVYNIKKKNDRVEKIAECNNALELITNVLNSCPNYVDVYLTTNSDNEAVSFLSNVFTNRLKIYSKN